MRFMQKVRCWEYCQHPSLVRVMDPTRPDKARRLGYKAKQVYDLVFPFEMHLYIATPTPSFRKKFTPIHRKHLNPWTQYPIPRTFFWIYSDDDATISFFLFLFWQPVVIWSNLKSHCHRRCYLCLLIFGIIISSSIYLH